MNLQRSIDNGVLKEDWTWLKKDQAVDNELSAIVDDVVITISRPNLDSLRATLTKFEIPSYKYSILEDEDDALCLSCDDGKWVTYGSERGGKSGVKYFTNVDDACFDLMHSMVKSKKSFNDMKRYYALCLAKCANEDNKESISSIIRRGYEKLLATVATL